MSPPDGQGYHLSRSQALGATVTQQYLIGELSLRFAQLQSAAGNRAAAQDLAQLRHEVETGSFTVLISAMERALELTDGLCWDSLTRGDGAGFSSEAAASAELREFGECAGLLTRTDRMP